MQITITDDAIYIILGLFLIAFLPHMHLFLIFLVMSIEDLLKYLLKLLNKFVEFTVIYIFPVALILLMYLAIFKTFILAFNSFKHDD